ncbi:hypothetical protein DL95DRAFT_461792 [Leptodontidium sp. 2 PMI_412]|nr:hypothetical protein DL95DRAFT_461792 [Leptodontidium sp. 2 PMI_412]
MSFGFSAGDFVASIVLISNVVRALDASTGSVAEVEALLSTLESLKQAIRTSAVVYLQCVLDDLNDDHSLVAKNIKGLIDDEHKHCDEILDSFIKSLKPYNEAFFRAGGSSLTRQARKITWLFRKTDAAQVNMNLTRHLTALEMYCTMFSDLQSAAIQKASSTTLSNILDIRGDVTTILSVIRPQRCIPAGLGYSWEATPALSDNVLLLDAIGRSDLHGLLVIMYRNIPGKQKIARREYNLTDKESDGVLVERSNWETTIHPGMTLSLNMIFPAAQTVDLHRCPQCDMPCLDNTLPGERRR